MLYVIFAEDHEDKLELRLATREQHLAYADTFAQNIVVAGPTLNEDGEAMNGTLFIVDFPDWESVNAFVINDPYRRAGLFKSVTIKPWKSVRFRLPTAE